MRGLTALLALLVACGGSTPPRPQVVVFTSHDQILSEPVLQLFEQRTGIDVRAVYDTEATKTTQLVSRLLARQAAPEADVFWNNEVSQTIVLQQAGLLEPTAPASAADIPARWRDAGGHWVGFGARARVFLIHTPSLPLDQAPRSVLDLAKPEWRGRFAIARPLFGTTRAHFAALRAQLGAERWTEFVEALWANDPMVVEGNAVAKNLVVEGRVPVCLTDTDDANIAVTAGQPVAIVMPDQDGFGTLVIPNTVCRIRGGPNAEAARQLIEFLASAEVEGLLARGKGAQLPVRPSVAPPSETLQLGRIVAMDLAPERIAAELEPTRRYFEAKLGK